MAISTTNLAIISFAVRNGVSTALDQIHRIYRNIVGQYVIMSALLEYSEDKLRGEVGTAFIVGWYTIRPFFTYFT